MMKMMFKWTKWLLLGLAGLLLLLVILVSTVMFTHPGLKLAVWGAEKALPQLRVGTIQGALFPGFSMHDVSFVDEALNIDARVERLALAISFRCFFEPKVCVDELALQGVNFQMPELPPASEELEEETAPLRSVSTPVPIFIDNVSFNDIHLNILDNQIDWQQFSTALSMQDDQLVIKPTVLEEINVALAESEAESEPAKTEIVKPEETAAQDIVLPEVWIPLTMDVERFDINNFRLAGETPVIVHHLGLVARAGGELVDVNTLELDMPEAEATLSTQVTLSADYPIKAQLDALVKQEDVKGQKLSLSASGSVGDLSLEATLSELAKGEIRGKVQPLKAQLPFDVTIQNAEAQWPLHGESDYQVSVPGLAAKGSLDGYDVTLETKASGKEIPDVDVTLNGKGTLEQIDLDSLIIKTLGGELSGKVMANWAAPVNWQADLNLQHIQPGLQWPEAEGDISGSLSTSGSLTDQGGWQVSLPTLDIDGVLRGYPLKMKGQLEASDKSGKAEDIKLTTQGLVLAHGPNQLNAKGEIDNQILVDVEVNFPDFAKTVPELSGNMNGNVAVRGSLKEPDIKLDLALNKLNWQKLAKVETVTLKGDISALPAPKADVSLVANNIVYDSMNIDSVDLELSGDEKRHQLTLDAVSDIASASLEILGSLEQKPQMIWEGALTRLSLETPQGDWALQKSTAVKVNVDKQIADVQAHCWVQAQSSVCLSEDISVGKSGEAKVVVNNFDFSQIKDLLPPETKLQGSVSALAVAKWAPDIKPQVTLDVEMPKGQAEQTLGQPITVGWESVSLKAALAKDKLDAQWLIDVADNGDLSGNVSLVNVSSESPEIAGTVSLSTLHLDFLAPLIGEYSLFKASMTTDLALSGDVMHPRINGQFLIDQIKLQGEVTPIDINSGQVAINFKGHQADLNAGIITPDGKLEITGDADWQDLQNWHSNARVFAKELKVDIPPMVKIKVEPDMTIEVTPKLAKVQGDINLPWARIVVEELPPSAVGVSSDLVILDENMQPIDDTVAVPFNVETDINIKIGNDFQLSAFGLEGGLRGNLKVSQRDKGPYIVGEVNIVDGSYRSFGQDLVIDEGKIIMSGPADQPYVSIKAIRNPDNTQDDVTAGVRVTGPASDPSMAIFSDPAMPQANALSYLLRGQDIDAESSGDAMTTALIGISLAKSGRVVGEIGEAFGVQDLQLDTAGSGDDSQVTVSGYILPGLQVKYGVGIFNSLGEFTVRYRLMQDLYLEAVSGVDSAVDLLYQFEFD
ncbi:Translocation and assembly module subunit TamB [Vibrio sp. B1FLJ16]|uniref:autotransporter assembly complex protein TamB n=1 Tax=Vibrio sp. B1FLJ16 TaxID=2751178 RepID=UPI0015F353B8|nr:translocation/assembly module TamB domain-containing protein [Vibrio sp. B1FLJ16]CAD7798183.1 Translocation and assembly module subunit TamB [Vibrio sp. B1FLJ16]CAE6882126.1 Translocation and assembly module subunit TamB [Vibrio sp. B1FLJ16]